MRKITSLILVCFLLVSISVGAAAAGTLKISGGKGSAGDTVFLTVELNEPVTGDAMGIRYSFDDTLLEARVDSFSWEKEGTITDFSKVNKNGVWASADPVDLQGMICVLAFRIKENALFTRTSVMCTVTINKDGEQIGSYSAEGTVSFVCDHVYGVWKNTGELGHSRACARCQGTQMQSHAWNSGRTIIVNGIQQAVMECSGCGIGKLDDGSLIEIPAENDEIGKPDEETTRPTVPNASTEPQQGAHQPLPKPSTGFGSMWEEFKESINNNKNPFYEEITIDQPHTEEYIPTEPAYRDYNQEPEHDEHQHDTLPQDHAHEHDATTQTTEGINKSAIWLLIAALIVTAVILVICLIAVLSNKKRKKK